jgi:CBS domain-containing protein
MRDRAVRRLPVVDENRRLLGLISLDDLLEHLGAEIANLAGAVRIGLTREGRPNRARSRRSIRVAV